MSFVIDCICCSRAADRVPSAENQGSCLLYVDDALPPESDFEQQLLLGRGGGRALSSTDLLTQQPPEIAKHPGWRRQVLWKFNQESLSPLATQGMVPALPGSWLEMHKPGPHPRPAGSESDFNKTSGGILYRARYEWQGFGSISETVKPAHGFFSGH